MSALLKPVLNRNFYHKLKGEILMKKTEENFLTMVTTVLTYLKNQTEVVLLPIIDTTIAEVEEKASEADEKNRMVVNGTSGATTRKDEARESMVDEILAVSSIGSVYANIIGDPEMAYICKTSVSEFDKIRDNEIGPMCSEIVDQVEAHKEQLADYGVNDETISNARAAITTYLNYYGEKESHSAEKVSARKALTTAISEVRNLLTMRLDPLMEVYRKSNPDFFNSYTAARVIKDLGIRHQNEEPAEA